MKPRPYNPHLVGDAIREVCRRAMHLASDLLFEVEAEVKGKKPDGSEDWVTPADRACEALVIKLLRERFPDFGIISEESKQAIPCSIPGEQIYFTVDPIDGTSAYKRKESGQWGCMISLVDGDEVVAVCIGNTSTGEMYYYRPDSDKTHWMLPPGHPKGHKDLGGPYAPTLAEQYLQIRELPHNCSPLAQKIILSGLFRKVVTASGSIGLTEAKRWAGIVGGSLLRNQSETPWDATPVIGMDRRLRFVALDVLSENNGGRERHALDLVERRLITQVETWPLPRETLVIHRSHLHELQAWCDHHNVTFYGHND